MQILKSHEIFEIEVLDKLNSYKLLDPLIFIGGTMLRLCHGLNRYSVDLDFWINKDIDIKKYYNKMKDVLNQNYQIKDQANKHFTILFEINSDKYPRNLKIEIRKKNKNMPVDTIIAYSEFANIQVLVKTLKLYNVLESKIKTFLERKEIRDCYDIDFLLMKGVKLKLDKKIIIKVVNQIDALNKYDYDVKLGSIIEPKLRTYYKNNKFDQLKSKLKKI